MGKSCIARLVEAELDGFVWFEQEMGRQEASAAFVTTTTTMTNTTRQAVVGKPAKTCLHCRGLSYSPSFSLSREIFFWADADADADLDANAILEGKRSVACVIRVD